MEEIIELLQKLKEKYPEIVDFDKVNSHMFFFDKKMNTFIDFNSLDELRTHLNE